jgi:hypothetical protein
MSEGDILYRVTFDHYGDGGLTIQEFEITNETEKSYMAKRIREDGRQTTPRRFPKDGEGIPNLGIFNNMLTGAYIFAAETTREEVEEFVVPKLKARITDWANNRIDYYNNILKTLE